MWFKKKFTKFYSYSKVKERKVCQMFASCDLYSNMKMVNRTPFTKTNAPFAA